MSDDAKEWRWVGEDGVEKKTSEQELIAELSSESLPHYVLVWKKGWGEWLPAMQVAELSWTLPPGKADEPVKPKERPGADAPPAPPLYRYPVIKRRAAGSKTDKGSPPRPGKVPRPPPLPPKPPAGHAASEASGVEPPAVEAPPPLEPSAPPKPPSAVARPATKTQDATEKPVELEPEPVEAAEELDSQDEVEEVEAVLEDSRPENVPPDLGGFALAGPDAAGRQAYTEESDDAETRVMPSKPPPPDTSAGAQYVAPHSPPRPSGAAPGSEQALPKIPPPPPQPKGFEQYVRRDQLRRLTQPPYLIGAAVAALLVIVVIVLASGGSEEETIEEEETNVETLASATPPADPTPPSEEAPPAPATAPAEPKKTAPATLEPCRFNRKATQLHDTAYVGVQAAFARVPGSSRVAVGFAGARREARGITIDAKSLDHDQIFRQAGRSAIESVVPVTESGKLGFEITRRARGGLASAVAMDHDPPFVVGLDDEGRIALERSGSDERSVLWPLEAEEITTPSIVPAEGSRFAAAFRQGATTGSIRAGWFSAEGSAEGALREIPTDEAFVGTPSIGSNASSVLIAFAARSSADDAWKVKLATAPHGDTPGAAETFELPPGGPGKNAISPRAVGLSDERWLVQWTEGQSGNRVVRVQVLDQELESVSKPTLVSPEGRNAGQGALWVDNGSIVSLFFVQGQEGHELWGASLSCPSP